MALPNGKHVMLSYNWKSQKIVSKVCDIFKAENIPVWFDIEGGMKEDIYKSMAEGVENAEIVCCFMSPEYQESKNCKLELKYAETRGKRILPCIVTNQKGWKPSNWLGLITAGLLYVNFKDDSEENIRLKTQELINQIKEQPSAPKPPSEPSYLVELVKYEYTRNACIERIMNPEKSFPIEQSYINLAIVKAKEQQEKEKQLRDTQHTNAIIGTFEEIYGSKTAIDVKYIFERCNKHEKQVLVFGRAGIGKSTFCRYAAYQWATGSYWPEYELLALIPLRRLTSNRYPPLPPGQSYSLVDLVKKEVFQYDLSENDENLLKKQFDAKKILWILDGYDEVVQNVPPHLEGLFEQLLKTPHHILTSRPYLNTLSYNVQMEITGFTDENIEAYVQQFFDQMKYELDDVSIKSQKLLNFLKSNSSIWGVAHIPVNLELICSLWSNNNWSGTERLTMTTLYNMMTEWLCRRYLTTPNKQIQNLSKNQVYQRCHKELAFLENLAFNAMESYTIIIRPTLLERALDEAKVSLQDHPHILNIGVLKSFNKQGIGTQIETDKDHYFVHLSFQEYFAARYLINVLKESSTEKAIKFIKHQKYDQRYTLVLSFVAGLLSESDTKPCLDNFWNTILREPLDLVGIRHIQLVISCIQETSDKSNLLLRTELLQWIATCINYSFSLESKILRKHLLQSLQRAPSVALNQIIMNIFINLLQSNNTETNTTVLSFISELKISNPSIAFITLLTTRLDDNNRNVREYACNALENIDEKAATNEMISKLVSALGDESRFVTESAGRALGNIGKKVATDEVINKLVSALGDESDGVRCNACNALGIIGEKAATNEVISTLVSALGDESWNVRKSACAALGQIGKKAATNEVISKLVSALGDERQWVRWSACEGLREMGEKAATNEVISKLVSTLGDDDEYVRCQACDALGHIGEKAATSEVISRLVSAIGDESEHVRQYACEALEKMGEKAATNEVITKLASALGDESEYGTRYACDALENIGKKAVTNEVISKLVSALGDESDGVRRNACEVLGKIGVKAATNEVISTLVSAFGDDSWEVRKSACVALGKIGEKAATNELISKLVSALEDEHQWIRWSACVTLGNIGEKAATNEVISKLVSRVEDEDVGVRCQACFAFGNIGEKTATNEVISKLVSALGDENKYVRTSACVCLGKMGDKIATNKVINKLVSVLEDENDDVKKSACEALENIGEKAATNEAISALVSALEDKNEDVRKYACKALGKMGGKAATNGVITKLASAVEDEAEWVRRYACEALGQIGEKAVTNEVMSKLMVMLKSDESQGVCNTDDAVIMILRSSSVIAQLDPKIIKDLCLHKRAFDFFKNVREDQLINVFFTTKNSDWLSVVTHLTLLKGAAVTATHDKVVVYGSTEASELPIVDLSVGRKLIEAFTDQAKRLHLSLEIASEAPRNEPRVSSSSSSSSSFCVLL